MVQRQDSRDVWFRDKTAEMWFRERKSEKFGSDTRKQTGVIQRQESREVWLKDKKAERCGKIKVNREKIVKQRVVVQRQVIIDVCFRERTRIQRRVVQRQDSHAEIQYVTIYS